MNDDLLTPPLSLPALPSGSMSVSREDAATESGRFIKKPRPDWHTESWYKRKSRAIYELQMREYVVRRRREGASFDQIATEIQQSTTTVQRYYKAAVDRAVELVPYDNGPQERDDHYGRRTGGYTPGRGPARDRRRGKYRKRTEKAAEGEVLMSPDEKIIREKCLLLIKAQQPYPVIGHALGITEAQARRYVHEELLRIEREELNNADLERRLMVEQINQMIAAIHPRATGQRIVDGEIVLFPAEYDAVDRMLKLFKQKADLMGLNQMPLVDIRIRLKMLAEENGYDYDIIEEISREVLPKYNLKLPGS